MLSGSYPQQRTAYGILNNLSNKVSVLFIMVWEGALSGHVTTPHYFQIWHLALRRWPWQSRMKGRRMEVYTCNCASLDDPQTTGDDIAIVSLKRM